MEGKQEKYFLMFSFKPNEFTNVYNKTQFLQIQIPCFNLGWCFASLGWVWPASAGTGALQ